jgi:Inner membrane protein YgaP-like, transmembrane domain
MIFNSRRAAPPVRSQLGQSQRRHSNLEVLVNVDRAVFIFAGSVLLLSLALTWLVSPYWLLLAAFVGLNMIQAAFTGFCPAAIVFRKLGVKEGPAFQSPSTKA